MKKTITVLFTVVLCSLLLALSFFQKSDVAVVKHFPIDQNVDFTTYDTDLSLLSETDQDEYDVNWTVISQLDSPIYLRQDVSLLYSDGRLKGILSKWKENEQDIQLKSSIHGEDSSHFQAISFHHGEIHYADDEIKSINSMSYDELYVIDSPHSALESFDQPISSNQEEWKHTLDHATNQQLTYHWKQLIEFFEIPQSKYNVVPLTNLHVYQSKPIPTLSKAKTQQVIGQLWEGLYKNYILGISRNEQPVKSFIPIVLFSKQGHHLIVLYEDQSGEKQQLIQYYSSTENSN
ncbi:hypothetical protein GH741_10580 [Aquibacillus halophilus]|uniref:CAP-associated domain-containing protein n=1 Tax=Aquibacillus halophilus TaxID=930132 RepID=A0A6A8DBM8_9BACI|nr:hypothetical protein [Aquibacillus halophilus]MRH43125.1 hypothetical protein [Aquibacillus halophilus]